MKKNITVTIKLYSGITRDMDLENYDPSKGLTLTVSKGTRLKKILKELGVSNLSRLAYFRSGERMGLWSRVKDGDEISCLKPSGGG